LRVYIGGGPDKRAEEGSTVLAKAMGGWAVMADDSLAGPRELGQSFESFMRSHSARLVQALTMISLDREAAADAAQEAFIALSLRWATDRPRDPAAWVYRVGINRCTDYRRFLARTARAVERLGSRAEPEAAGVVEGMPGREFTAILRSLPRGQRTAATLYYLNDLSVAEIASVMGISEGTVNSHLHRAREALKGLLKK
jgi:RNA polymerase sigma-70 factor, ECF subfamily